jgi:WD40 repeat protein
LAARAKKNPDGPFPDVGAAVERLLDAGAAVEDLCCLARHERYGACFETLYKIEELGVEGEDLCGLHETILGAEPSGLEARPGSWPAAGETRKAKKAVRKTPQTAPRPLLEMKKFCHPVFSPDGKRLAFHATTPQILDVATGEVAAKCEMPSHTYQLAYSADGGRIAGGSTSGRIGVCDARTGKAVFQLRDCKYEATFVAFSPDGSSIVSTDHSGNVWVWDAKTGKLRRRVENPGISTKGTSISHAAFTPDGRSLVLVVFMRPAKDTEIGRTRFVRWDWPLGESESARVELGKVDVHRIAFGPQAACVAVIQDRGLAILDARSGRSRLKHRTQEMPFALAWSPDGNYLATTAKGQVLLLDARSMHEVASVAIKSPFGVAFSPDSRLLAMGSSYKGQVWEVARLVKRS